MPLQGSIFEGRVERNADSEQSVAQPELPGRIPEQRGTGSQCNSLRVLVAKIANLSLPTLIPSPELVGRIPEQRGTGSQTNS